MNADAKRALLNSLQLDTPSAAFLPPTQTRRYVSAGLVFALCVLGSWLLVKFSPSWATQQPETLVGQASGITQQPVTRPIAPAEDKVVLQANGYITARQAATVSARTTAVVQTVYVEEGDFVLADTLLARLDDRLKQAEYEFALSQLAVAQAQVSEVASELAAAQRRMARLNQLARAKLASEAELDTVTTQVQSLQARLREREALAESTARQTQVFRVALQDYLIRAPFDGVVTQRSAQPGETVSPVSAGGGFTRTGIATLVNMDSLEIEVDVSETFIHQVRQKHAVRVVLNAYPDISYDGEVITIIPRGDRNKGTVKVRVKLLAADERVLPDLGARVDFLDV